MLPSTKKLKLAIILLIIVHFIIKNYEEIQYKASLIYVCAFNFLHSSSKIFSETVLTFEIPPFSCVLSLKLLVPRYGIFRLSEFENPFLMSWFKISPGVLW